MKNRVSIQMFVVLLFVLSGITPAYAQEPTHTGPPDVHLHIRDEPYSGIPAYCDRYHVEANGIQDVEIQRWLNEDGSVIFSRLIYREQVTLTNSVTRNSVDVFLRFKAEFDYVANTTTMDGIRSAILKPNGGLEEVNNVGHLVVSGMSVFEGDVLSVAGRWEAVSDLVFDHRAWPCEQVAD
ncbi:MAG: hypothetical protein KDD84_20145 [Caldilineaceae bacterium]|nr:hypothetical protein [Caldilineaceae bacterium]